MSRVGGLLVAAGRSTRMGFDKVWADLRGRPVLVHGLQMLADAGVGELVLVVAADRVDQARALVSELGIAAQACAGGERRRDSVARGLACLPACEWVVVHDAARPLASSRLVRRGLDAARECGAAVPAIPVADTLKRVADGRVVETVPREDLWCVQTPQIFRREALASALAASDEDVGDEATLVEWSGAQVRVFLGEEHNIKLTQPDDLLLAEAMLGMRS